MPTMNGPIPSWSADEIRAELEKFQEIIDRMGVEVTVITDYGSRESAIEGPYVVITASLPSGEELGRPAHLQEIISDANIEEHEAGGLQFLPRHLLATQGPWRGSL